MTVGPGNKETVAKTLGHWKDVADLAGIRDAQGLAKLPEAERAAFRKLWDDVDGLLAEVAGGRAKLGVAKPEFLRDVFARPR